MIHSKAAILYSKNKIKVEKIILPKIPDDKVLVKIKFSSICHTQLQEIEGKRGKDNYLPHCLGHEATGIVIGVGNKIKKVKKNDRVCLTWVKSLGINSFNSIYLTEKEKKKINAGPVNTFSEYSLISENKIIKLNKNADLKKSVLLGCAVPTAFNCFITSLKNTNKKNILILGAGGLGLACVYAAKKSNFKNIFVLDQNKKKLNIAKKLGASKIVHVNKKNILKKINFYENYFYNIIECTGNLEILNNTIKCAKILGGKYIVIGNYPNKSKINIDTWDIVKGRVLSGAWTDGEIYENKLKKITQLMNNFNCDYFFGKKIYKIEELKSAINDFKNGKVIRPLIKFF